MSVPALTNRLEETSTMCIVQTDRAPRKGQIDSQLQEVVRLAELSLASTCSEDSWTDGSLEGYSGAGDADLPALLADEPPPDLDPRGAVEAWKLAALGHRPRD